MTPAPPPTRTQTRRVPGFALILTILLGIGLGLLGTRFFALVRVADTSMTPTLHPVRHFGWHSPRPGAEAGAPAARWRRGETAVDIVAATNGILETGFQSVTDLYIVRIGDTRQGIPKGLEIRQRPGADVQTGEILARGIRKSMDWVLVRTGAPSVDSLERGDLVWVRPPPPHAGHPALRRVAALPGETVQIDPPWLRIDGRKVTNQPFQAISRGEFGSTGFTPAPALLAGRVALARADETLAVPGGHVFVLADQAGRHEDSRFYGPVPIADIQGRATAILWPPDRLQRLP